MGWRQSNRGVTMMMTLTVFTFMMICACNGARRSQRRQDTELYSPSPSVESLQEIAEAMGAAGFEHYTEGKALVKRLIPANSQPDLDIVEYQGVIGRAGVDFPAYPNIPPTGFNCKNVPTGYYADLETDCQVFHICDTSRKISFLCPNGTIFSQSHLICDWWFKVDCASAPALYESSAEYYSNEQKKSQKITQSLSKNQDLQQIGTDTNIRAEPRRVSVNVPSTTERLLRSRHRQTEVPKATAKTFQTLFTDSFNPTQRTAATEALEHRRKNLVQLISNNFGNPPSKSTVATYADNPIYRTTAATPDFPLKEMQVAAETASFTNNNNRQYLQDFHNKNYRPYPVYNPNAAVKAKPKTNPNLTTLYDIREKHLSQPSQASPRFETTTTKRPTLLPYTKSYTTILEKQDPYTRPGVSLLKNYLHKEKNKTVSTTEKIGKLTSRRDRSDQTYQENKVAIETKNSFESATKIPHTTKDAIQYTEMASSDRHDVFSTTNHITQPTTEAPYQERRQKLMKKLNLDDSPTEATSPTTATDRHSRIQADRAGVAASLSLPSKSLHSLAIYYATAIDNLSSTISPEETETVTPSFDEYEAMEEALPALFSPQTINKYSNLFSHQTPNAELVEGIKEDPNGTYNELSEDLSVQQSQNPIATSPQIRELAQVFTHALSAYLQDPVQFRKVLSDIRPTHPSFGDLLTTTEDSINTEPTTTVNEEDDEILGFSDDNNELSPREPKALGFPTTYGVYESSTTARPVTEPVSAAYVSSTTLRTLFRCCGKISASYTSASPRFASSTTSTPLFSNTVAANVNTLSNNYSETISTTESDYSLHKYGGFQNNALSLNDNPYGAGNSISTEGKPLNEYIEATNLPTAWGIDPSVSTVSGFESQKIKTTTIIPATSVHFTETDSIELENDEELQRAHSQSFAAPQGNSIRQGKQLTHSTISSESIKKPAEDLEAPTGAGEDITTIQTTTQQPTTTQARVTETETLTTTPALPETVFTSPDSEKTTFIWSSDYGSWQSTVIDPITLNDGLSPTGPDQNQGLTGSTYAPNTATTATDYTVTEQTVSSTSNYEITSLDINNVTARTGRLLKDSSTETSQDLTTIADTVVEKAKEIMNVTTAEKLMNVMKKTKSKTVKRLILLLIQTCDDDHNTTAEASKKALLEALMAVSQKDMEDMAKEEETTELPTTEIDRSTAYRRIERTKGDRRGKSLNLDASAVNSLSSSVTTESIKPTQEDLEFTATTPSSFRTNTVSRRGGRKFHTKATTIEPSTTKVPFIDIPKAEARSSQSNDLKTAADTRALELLRSLYSIAARWG